MAITARDVIGAEVELDRMTCKNGWSKLGVSKVRISRLRCQSIVPISPAHIIARQIVHIPLHPFRSLLNRANALIRGLSWRLFPFFPRKPQRLSTGFESPSPTLILRPIAPGPPSLPPLLAGLTRGLMGLIGIGELLPVAAELLPAPPPRIAETELCAHRACLRIAEVTVIHSLTTKPTGSTAIDVGRRTGCGVVAM